MSIGDTKRILGPVIEETLHHPHAPVVGDVAAYALSNAYGLATTGARFLGQWWRPVVPGAGELVADHATGGGAVTDGIVYQTTVDVPDHFDVVRAHLVWSLPLATYGTDVSHRLLVDSAPGGTDVRSSDGADWAEDLIIDGGWPNLYETEVSASIPAGGSIAIDVRVSIPGAADVGLITYNLVGITLYAEVL